MGVAKTLLLSLIFNISLPTADVVFDVLLMRDTLNFAGYNSVTMAGCRACYYKNEDQVYTNIANNICIEDGGYGFGGNFCGQYAKTNTSRCC